MSLIEREAACLVCSKYFDSDGCSGDDVAMDIQSDLLGLPSVQPEPQWVSCNERLPRKDGVYLVYAPYYTGGSSTAKENHEGIMFSRYKNKKWSIEHGYYKRPNCVRAWMPLPEPYKEGAQDG